MAIRPFSAARALRSLFLVSALVQAGIAAQADEIHVVSSGGFAEAYRQLAPGFEAMSGHKLVSAWGPSMGSTPQAIPNRLQRGEPIDVVIMVADSLDDLVARGRVSGATLLARSRIGMAVKAGSAKPDISTVEALRSTLLSARSIAYSDSASGVFLSTVLFRRLGIEAQVKDKATMVPAEPVGQVVARGDADIGFQRISELLPVAGIEIVGPLPDDAQQVTAFSAGIVSGSAHQEAARALVDYLSSASAAGIIRRTGLDPAREPAK